MNKSNIDMDKFLVPDAPGHLLELYQTNPEFYNVVKSLSALMYEYGRATIHDALWLADLIEIRRLREQLYG